MIKAIFFIGIGAVGAYLYMNPGDVDGAVLILKEGTHNAFTYLAEATQ